LRFVNTNILLYSVSIDPRDKNKSGVAETLLQSPDLALSVQVLQEFYAQVTRPTRFGAVTHEQTTIFIAALKRYPIIDNSIDVLEEALIICKRWKLSIWDANIIAAAKALGCEQVLSEDMQDDQTIAGVRVVNPFGWGQKT
jgi:predicted nucleic acid-binding protein